MSTVLPPSVQAQLDAAEELRKQAYPDTAPAPEPQTPEPAPPPAEPVPPTLTDPTESQQYKTLLGKYNAEVPRMTRTIAELTATVQRLEQQLLAKANEPPPAPPPEPPGVTPQDEEVFGKDLVDLQRRIAAAEAARAMREARDQLKAEVAPVRDQVQHLIKSQAMTAEETYFARIKEQLPRFLEVISTPEFGAWAAEIEPIAGKTRQQLLDDTLAALNHQHALAVLATCPLFQTPPPRPDPAAELRSQLAPSGTRASSPTPPAARLWTGSEYERAFDPRYTVGRAPNEVAQEQAEADKAAVEGRVDWNR